MFNLKFATMKGYQVIAESEKGEKRVVTTMTQKRKIESFFNRLMKHYSNDSKMCVTRHCIGYCTVEFFGEFSTIKDEYYIIKTA